MSYGSVAVGADPVLPKEGLMDSRVEHLVGVNGKSLLTRITNCRSKHTSEGCTRGELSVADEVVTTPAVGAVVGEEGYEGGAKTMIAPPRVGLG